MLVGGAPFPEPEELPDDLAGLRRRSGLFLSDLEWKAGTQRLIEAMRHVLGVADAPIEDKRVQQVVAETQAASKAPPVAATAAASSLPAAVLPLALGGAALLTVGLFMRWDKGHHSFLQNDFGGRLEHGGAFTSLAPIGIVVAAVLGLLLVLKPDTRAMGAGVLFGAGIAGGATYLAVLQAGHARPGATVGLLGALAGSVLVLVAGLIAGRTTADVARSRAAGAAISALAGAVLMVIATAIAFNGGGDSKTSHKVADSFDAAFDPVVTSLAIAAIAVLLLRPWRHLELSAGLLTLGCLDALLWVRYLAVPIFEDSKVGSFGPGGLVGLLGAGLVIVGGYLGLQGSRAYAASPVAVQP